MPNRKGVPKDRHLHLIRRNVSYPVVWTSETARVRDIWIELQNGLFLDRHLNSISVLFRVMLELAVDHYLGKNLAAGAHPNDALQNKIDKANKHLLATGVIDKKYEGEIRKFANGEAIVSANTMHRYVHSKTFAPSPVHLRALWDTTSQFIVHCLNAQ
jgi:hypothetical protein